MDNNLIVIDRILDAEKYFGDVDAVIFDLDDTLYSEKEYVRSGYEKIAEHFDIPELADEMWEVFEKGGRAIDDVLASHGMLDKRDEALHIYRFQKPDINLYRGVAEMLKRVRKIKKLGIITDGRPEGQRAKIDALGLEADEIIITDELGGVNFRKPNKMAFEIMQKRLGVAFGRMVYVGDNIKKDFQAPKALGMKTIYFKNTDSIYNIT